MARRFNDSQRQALFILAGGKCQICGEELTAEWEADHKHPYSKGGETKIINGQAACQKCNRVKGDRVAIKARDWQYKFIDAYNAAGSDDFLLVATPGAGKTVAALMVAEDKIKAEEADAIIIVAPTEQLKRQWAGAAHKMFGIDLDPYWKSGPIKAGYQGICITYAQAASSDFMLDYLCRDKYNVFVIFDEVHHAGDSLAWGDAIKSAFDYAAFRLAVSGTPFRSDNNEIPFVTYKDGESQADYTYGYGSAITDGVCRSVSFPSFDGDFSWFDGDDILEGVTFDDDIEDKHDRQRLRTALTSGNSYLKEMLEAAHQKLIEVRQDDPAAGGMVTTIDKRHAESVASLVEAVTGEQPTLVHSDNDDAQQIIEQFKKDPSKKWIVAVKMVSEGVDIPRLRVGVYATNVRTEMLFRQIIGRVVRRDAHNDDWAFFFVPKDKKLVEYMEQIKQERNHVIDAMFRRIQREIDTDTERAKSEYIPIDAARNNNDLLIADGHQFDTDFTAYAVALCQRLNISANEAQASRLVEEIQKNVGQQPATETKNEPGQERYKTEGDLRTAANKLAYRLAIQLSESHNTAKSPKDIVWKIHQAWTRRTGNKQGDASTEELKRKIEWLPSQIDEFWRYV